MPPHRNRDHDRHPRHGLWQVGREHLHQMLHKLSLGWPDLQELEILAIPVKQGGPAGLDFSLMGKLLGGDQVEGDHLGVLDTESCGCVMVSAAQEVWFEGLENLRFRARPMKIHDMGRGHGPVMQEN